MTDQNDEKMQILSMTSDIVCTYISGNHMEPEEVPAFINEIYRTLQNSGDAQAISTEDNSNTETPAPAVPIDQSVKKNYIVCLEDGKELKMLKRYLKTNYDMTPDEYRARWNLPSDYPMVAPSYAKKRSKLAKEIGLGTKTGNQKAA